MGRYRTWEDLDDAAPPPSAAAAPLVPEPGTPEIDKTAAAIERLGGPPELVELLRRKEELEAQLRQFAAGEPEPYDERRAKCFPVKVHTKESRIEDRRLRRRDEQLALLNQRSLEHARLERVRAEQDRQARLRQLEAALVARIEAEQRQEAQRRALEQAQLARRHQIDEEEQRERLRREAERMLRAEAMALAKRDEQSAEEARRAEEQQTLLQRWQSDRQTALERTRRERAREAVSLEQDNDRRRAALARRVGLGRHDREERERLVIEKRDAECRLRGERRARLRSEQRAFEASRDSLRAR